MFLALRDLRFARGRFALMAAVVGLLALLVVLLSGLAAGLGNQSTAAVAGLPADHLAFSRPTGGQALSFDSSTVGAAQLEAWQRTPGVTEAALLGVAPSQLASGTTQRPVSVLGSAPGSFITPTQLTGAGVAVLGPQLRDAAGAEAGATVTIGGRSLTVVASPTDSWFNHLPVAWVALPDWDRLTRHAGSNGQDATVVALRTGPEADLAAGDAAAGTTTTTLGGSFAAIGSYTAENGSLTLIRVLLFAVGALVVGAFFTVWTIQRMPDLAVLKAIGATSRYLVTDSLAQAGTVLVIGSGVGAALATGLGLLASDVVPFVVSPATTVVPLSVTMLTGMVGALAAVRSIVAVDPLAALGASR